MKKKIAFIINPISGGKNKLKFPGLASEYLDKTTFHSDYVFTERPGHAFDIAGEMLKGNTDILVAVGGDGTINEVASAILGSDRVMGIVPYGSGNGLARSLGIPLNDRKAILRLNKLNSTCIDAGELNGKKFFNMAGIGFDAHISTLFAEGVKRGLHGYVKTTLSEISSYRPQHYRLEIDGKCYEQDAFMISIANSSQFGNNAHISPFASLKDGLLDICITKPFPLYHFPVLGYRMFNKSIHRSKYIEIIQGREIRIFREYSGAVHLDGEPVLMGSELNIKIRPLGLSILV
ncbi:MAG: diacylglycerol kinase family protein [Daejeonella sp.]